MRSLLQLKHSQSPHNEGIAKVPLPPQDQDRITNIFFPHIEHEKREVMDSGCRFAYYTTADTATKILESKQIWLRNTAVMNDYSEVEYGFNCLNCAYKTEPGINFNTALNTCFPGLDDEVKELFNGWLPIIREDTYVTCVSEHLPDEDQHGRLSMWRAYGCGTGVALVINGAVMFGNTQVLKVFSSPVAYERPNTVADQLNKIAKNISNDVDFLRSVGRDVMKNSVFNMFLFGILCTKHPGFHEEREWRAIASPKIYPTPHCTSAIEVIYGTPQRVLKLDLKDHQAKGLVGLAIPELIERIIIGPCQFPAIIRAAFLELLQEAGVPDAAKRIIISDIPLRQA
ncbi:MAG: DUF2971 domain-containing protein [Nitrospira sp.]|jgi:Protein of unknown function (DUF2971)|nr:MAG: DUF2971 domain-containing protein [Nitrospira sp.]